MNQSASTVFEYGSLGNSEDSDSEETSSGATVPADSPVAVRKPTPSLEVVAKRRSGSLTTKSPSLEEYAYAAQLEKHMSTSPLQALAAGFQTVRDLVLGPKITSTPPPRSPTTTKPPSSLGESFFMIADPTSDINDREQRLQEELARVQGEFQKIQHLLDKVMLEQQTKPQPGPPTRRHHSPAHAMPSTAIAREAQLKQSLRENYLAGSDVHLSKSELESEIKKLREQLTTAERRNSEWAAKWEQVKQKAMKKRDSRITNSTAAPQNRSETLSTTLPSHLLSSTPNNLH